MGPNTGPCETLEKALGPVTADLTTTVLHSYKLLINDIKPDHSLTPCITPETSFDQTWISSSEGWSMLNTVPFDAAILEKNIFLVFPNVSLWKSLSPWGGAICVPRDLIWTNLNLLVLWMLHAKYCPIWCRFFKHFPIYHYVKV